MVDINKDLNQKMDQRDDMLASSRKIVEGSKNTFGAYGSFGMNAEEGGSRSRNSYIRNPTESTLRLGSRGDIVQDSRIYQQFDKIENNAKKDLQNFYKKNENLVNQM